MANDEFMSRIVRKAGDLVAADFPFPLPRMYLGQFVTIGQKEETEKTETELQDRAYKYLKQLVSDSRLVLQSPLSS